MRAGECVCARESDKRDENEKLHAGGMRSDFLTIGPDVELG